MKTYFKNLTPEEKENLAEASGTKTIYLSQIASGFRKPSPKLAKLIESATNRLVSKAELRPDIY